MNLAPYLHTSPSKTGSRNMENLQELALEWFRWQISMAVVEGNHVGPVETPVFLPYNRGGS